MRISRLTTEPTDHIPSRTAIIDGDRSLSFAELDDAADKLAEGLAKLGVEPGSIVGVRLQICLEWSIVNAALGKLGCRLLAINWRLTPEETAYILGDCKASALICDDGEPEALLAKLTPLGLVAIVLLGSKREGTLSFKSMLDTESAPKRVARGAPPLIVYTSGTTGRPKGVITETCHATPEALAAYLKHMASHTPLDETSVSLMTMPLNHGSGPVQIRGALAAGAKVVLMRRFDPEAALALIEKHRITNWVAVPTMLKRIEALPPEIVERYDLTSLRVIRVGAAPITPSLKNWVMRVFGPILHEGYGSTETGMITYISPEEATLRPGSAGKPYNEVAISIRDDEGNEVDAGRTGEIWVRTPFGIRSYVGCPDLGPDVLDANGFFRTGDVGRLDGDQYLYITDRAKDMIVSGGVNIYPAEIECVILDEPEVQDVAVIGVPDEDFGEQVKAFVELKPGAALTNEVLLDRISTRLASYKRPKSVEFINQLPRNAMGKILKRVLREPFWADKERAI